MSIFKKKFELDGKDKTYSYESLKNDHDFKEVQKKV